MRDGDIKQIDKYQMRDGLYRHFVVDRQLLGSRKYAEITMPRRTFLPLLLRICPIPTGSLPHPRQSR